MKLNTKATPGCIWVWTDHAEQRAEELGLENRPAGEPAWLGRSILMEYAPTVWVQKGYVMEWNIEPMAAAN